MITLLWSFRVGWREPPRLVIPSWLLFASCAFWLWFQSVSINSVLGVITLLTLSRLVTARRAQDYTQLIFLTFGQVLFATTLEFELTFGLALCAYMIVVTTMLTLNHLRGEVEMSTLLDQHIGDDHARNRKLLRRLESRRLIDRSFILGVGSIAALLCLAAIVLFFMLPRVGGQWYQGYQLGPTRSGFSGDVTLGQAGEIQLDDQIAFRVVSRYLELYEPIEVGGELPSPDAPAGALPDDLDEQTPRPLEQAERYWRGRALDQYQRGRWSQTTPLKRQLKTDRVRWLKRRPALYVGQRFIIQHVYLESRSHEALFHMGQPIAFSLPSSITPKPLKITAEGGVEYDRPGDLHYGVISVVRDPDSEVVNLTQYERDLEWAPELDRYLQLPDELRDDLRRYALKVIGDERQVVKISTLIEKHLQTQFRYQLHQAPRGPTSPRDPVLRFLLETRAGHCEYFSSAMILLLRSVGIPARHITGYSGGEWSELGNYYIIRQRDAHAWVQVWAGQKGAGVEEERAWLRFDPTPARPVPAKSVSAWSTLMRLRDQAQFLWFRYVLGFDAGDQARAAARTQRGIKRTWSDFRNSKSVRSSLRWLNKSKPWILISLIVALLILGFRKAGQTSLLNVFNVFKKYNQAHWLNRFLLWWFSRGLSLEASEAERDDQWLKWQRRAQLEVSLVYERALSLGAMRGARCPIDQGGEYYADQLQPLGEAVTQAFSCFHTRYQRLRFGGDISPEELDLLRAELRHFKECLEQVDVSSVTRS